METSLHREQKQIYAGPGAQLEVRVAGYRIDAVVGEELIEVQHGPLSAIRDKVRRLLETHDVRIVKPIVMRKMLIVRSRRGGRVVRRRVSPKQGKLLDLFDELIHLTRLFPHPRLTLEAPLVEVEEWRYPGHGRRRWRRDNDFLVEDQKLVRIDCQYQIRTVADLAALAACKLPKPFHTGHLAAGLGIPRPFAQRIAYCLRKMGAVDAVGKERNSWLYKWKKPPRAA